MSKYRNVRHIWKIFLKENFQQLHARDIIYMLANGRATVLPVVCQGMSLTYDGFYLSLKVFHSKQIVGIILYNL